MEDTIKEQNITKSLQLLRDGFKKDFASFVYQNESMNELLMELSSEFVDANIPVIDDELQVELSMMLMESLDIVAR
jgi:hypothetical protein